MFQRRIRFAALLAVIVTFSVGAGPAGAECDLAVLASPAQVTALGKRLVHAKRVRVQDQVYTLGRLNGAEVVLGQAGTGAVQAARVASLAVGRFHPRRVIAGGMASAVHPDLRPRDIVIGTRTVRYDAALQDTAHSPAGAAPALRHDAPYLDTEPGLLGIAREAARHVAPVSVPPGDAAGRPRIVRGAIASGHASALSPAMMRELRSALNASAADREGAAVAEVCAASNVAWLVIAGIRDSGAGRTENPAASAEAVAENVARLIVAIAREMRRGALPAGQEGTARTWTVAYELAFGDATPYGREYPSLYDNCVPYTVKRNITQEVLDRVTRIAAREAGVRASGPAYTPGAYKDYAVVPAAQCRVEGTAAEVTVFMDVVGYLAQQTEVIASTPLQAGGLSALRVRQVSGRDLLQPATAERFWKSLRSRAPLLPGFSTLTASGSPVLVSIATEGDWRADQKSQIRGAVAAVSKEQKIPASPAFTRVALLSSYNNWLLEPDGAGYLNRVSRAGHPGLAERLRNQYRPAVEQWIRDAYRGYPSSNGETSSAPSMLRIARPPSQRNHRVPGGCGPA